MPFSIGSSATLDDFISSLLAFAVANAGFAAQTTVQSSAGSGSVNIRTVSKGGVYWSMHYHSAYLGTTSPGVVGVRAYMAYGNPTAGVNVSTSSLAPTALNSTAQSHFTMMAHYGYTGAYANHWLYTDGTCVHGILELSSGIYGHISFGLMTKQGTWTGGEYVSANSASTLSGNWYNWGLGSDRTQSVFSGQWCGNLLYGGDTCIRMNNAGVSADFWRANQQIFGSSMNSTSLFMSAKSTVSPSRSTPGHPMGLILSYAPSTSTWRSPMLPILFMRGVASGTVYVLGRIPRVTFTRMTDDMPNASLIHTDWRVFPIFSRLTTTTSTVAPGSGNWAIAYREI